MTLAVALFTLFVSTVVPAETLPPTVQAAVQKRYGNDVHYLDGTFDLNGDGKPEIVVHVVGGTACGTGGCPTMVFTPDGPGYRLVTTIGLTNPPIRVADASTAGWHNLIVHVSGGGVKGGDVELAYGGSSYPRNPTVPGPRVKRTTAAGKVLIAPYGSFEDARPLVNAQTAGLSAAYVCEGHTDTTFSATFHNDTDPPSVVLTMGDKRATALQVRSGSGAHYQGPDVDFWEHQGEAMVTWSGVKFTCRPI